MQWFLYMNGRNCWKGKGNQHILLYNKQLVYRHNKAILGQNERFIEKIKIAILTTSFTAGESGGPQPPFPPNWGISIKHYLNQVKVLTKKGIYIGVSKNLLEFWKSYLKKETAWGPTDTPSVNKGSQVFSCEFCEISRNTCFYRTILMAASVCSATTIQSFIDRA